MNTFNNFWTWGLNLKSDLEIVRKIVEDFIRDQRTINRLLRSDISALEKRINRLETNDYYKEI